MSDVCSLEFAGDERDRATPVPIPNTVVKPVSADGTAPARGWESRPPPASQTKPAPTPRSGLLFSCLLPIHAKNRGVVMTFGAACQARAPRQSCCRSTAPGNARYQPGPGDSFKVLGSMRRALD